jgi:formate--tetrahydrofolate ligase
MAVLALAESRADCARRLGEMTVGFDYDGKPVHAKDLQANGAMMVLLNEAIMPNLVQTTEQTPALIHAGPFANIAHGTSSVLAQRMALTPNMLQQAGFRRPRGKVPRHHDAVVGKPSAALVDRCHPASQRDKTDNHPA